MKIDRVTLYLVRMNLINAFRASSHSAQELNHILVRAEGGGHVGWGECSAPNDPYYMGETYETAWHMLRDFLVPPILGVEWSSIAELISRYELVKANTFAKAGLEMAAWDLLGRSEKRSVAELLGGTREKIQSGVSLGMESTPERLHALIAQYVEQGYRRVKLKVSPGHDASVLEGVRARFPTLPLMADANSAYTLADIPALKRLDPLGLIMIEQPLAWNDIVDHAELQRAIQTPVCLDESIRCLADARQAIALGSCKIINIKAGRVGGLLEAKRIHDYCYAHGIPVWCGGMHDYGVGRAANVALASLPGFSIPGDISASDKYFVEDIVEPPILAERGEIPVPHSPGLGYEVVEARVRARTVRELVLPS
jgi:O-succinylbenzoate synthase